MQVYCGAYNISDWPYWFDVFILSFVVFIAIGVIVYSFYKDQKDAVKNIELQINNYATWLQREQNISSSLEKENLKLRKEIQTLRQNKNKEESKEISW